MLDNHLADDDCIAGRTITIGDMPLAIATYRWLALPIERENTPNLNPWYDAIAACRAFRKNVIDIGLH